MGILLTAGSAISFNSLILDRSDETVDDIPYSIEENKVEMVSLSLLI
jgi:hypothetical protein